MKQQNPLSGSVTVFNYIFNIFNKRKKSNLNSASPYMIRNRCCSKCKKSTAQMFKIAKKVLVQKFLRRKQELCCFNCYCLSITLLLGCSLLEVFTVAKALKIQLEIIKCLPSFTFSDLSLCQVCSGPRALCLPGLLQLVSSGKSSWFIMQPITRVKRCGLSAAFKCDTNRFKPYVKNL